MKHLSMKAGLIAALALAGVSAHAKDDTKLDACINQFVSTQFADFAGKVTVHKESDDSVHVPLIVRREHIVVTAVDPTSGALLATATCKSTKAGLSVSIKSTKAMPASVARTEKSEVTVSDAG